MVGLRRVAWTVRGHWRALMGKGPIRQAGGVVVRRGAHGPEILIVTARRNRKRWVLPKGTIKRGESARAAALREVKEEAGVRGTIVGRAGKSLYGTRAGSVLIEYFVIRYRRPAEGAEDRGLAWCAPEDAIARLSYASARRVVLEAAPTIRKALV